MPLTSEGGVELAAGAVVEDVPWTSTLSTDMATKSMPCVKSVTRSVPPVGKGKAWPRTDRIVDHRIDRDSASPFPCMGWRRGSKQAHGLEWTHDVLQE
jgi:hypothetical protein